MIVVIVVSGILAGVVMQFVTAPIDAYTDQSRRARLVDISHNAIGRISRDVQQALPNSIRTGCGGQCVEFLRVAAAGRYRAGPAGDLLSFVAADADTSFDVLGPFDGFAGLSVSSSAAACVAGSAACVAIYSTGQAGTDVWNADHSGAGWQPDNLATLSAVSGTSVSFVNSGFSSGQPVFPAASPDQRFYIVDTPVSYLCDSTVGTLRRYQGYNVTHPQTAVDQHAELLALSNPAEHALLAHQVVACTFTYLPGTPSRNGLLTVRIQVSEAGEGVTLLEQVHVPNMP